MLANYFFTYIELRLVLNNELKFDPHDCKYLINCTFETSLSFFIALIFRWQNTANTYRKPSNLHRIEKSFPFGFSSAIIIIIIFILFLKHTHIEIINDSGSMSVKIHGIIWINLEELKSANCRVFRNGHLILLKQPFRKLSVINEFSG